MLEDIPRHLGGRDMQSAAAAPPRHTRGKLRRAPPALIHDLYHHRRRLLLCALILSASACTPAAPTAAALTPVTLQLVWTHSAQFAGFYAADQNGYYAAAGLAVRFLEGGPGRDRIAPISDGRAEFAVFAPEDLLLARAGGTPITAVAVVYRRSPWVLASLSGSGITRPQDFAGKTIEISGVGRHRLEAITRRVGLDPSRYSVVDSTPDLERLFTGQVHVRAVFLTNEVLAARAAGHDLHVIFPDDYGVRHYADTIVAHDSLINGNPDLMLRFLRATLKGWTYALENPLAIGPMLVKYRPDADPQLENTKMVASLPLIDTGEDTIGWMKGEVWADMAQLLWRNGALVRPVDPSEAYTMRFLREIYPR